MDILEAEFVDGTGIDGLRVSKLKGMFSAQLVVSGLLEVELPDAVIGFRIAPILIASGQRIVRSQLIVNARAQVGPGLRIGYCGAIRSDAELVIGRRAVAGGKWIGKAAENGAADDV